MLLTLTPYKIIGTLVGGILIVGSTAGVSWYLTTEYVTNKYELILTKADKEALDRLNRVLEGKNEVENRLQTVKDEIQSEYQETLDQNARTIARLRADNVRLRDPGYQNSGNTCTSNSDSTDIPSEADSRTGTLSESATDFLLTYAGDADETLEQLRACRSWVDETKKELDKWNTERTNR